MSEAKAHADKNYEESKVIYLGQITDLQNQVSNQQHKLLDLEKTKKRIAELEEDADNTNKSKSSELIQMFSKIKERDTRIDELDDKINQ